MALFYYDIWAEPERRKTVVPDQTKVGGSSVDIFITTLDEAPYIVEDSLRDATKVHLPDGTIPTEESAKDAGRVATSFVQGGTSADCSAESYGQS